jgi:hypothetical protein
MKTLSMVAAAALCAAGCATSVTARKAPGVSLAQYRTFAFYPAPAVDQNAAQLMSSPAGQAVQNQLAQDLANRGLVQVSPNQNPDLLVAYHMKTRQRVDVTDWGYGPGWGWWGWYGGYYGPATVNEWTEGTIIVDFIDPHTNQVVWRGTATSPVSHPDNPNPEKAASAVNKIMKKYPVEMAGRANQQM